MLPGDLPSVGGTLFKFTLVHEPSSRIYVDSHRRTDMEAAMGLQTVRTTLMLEAITALGDRFCLEGILPFARIRNFASGTDDSVDGAGIGDATLSLTVRIPKASIDRVSLDGDGGDSAEHPQSVKRLFYPVVFTLGARLPTGDNNGKDTRGQPIAEQTLQIGQGVPSVLAGVRGWHTLRPGLTAFGRLESRMQFLPNKHKYRYGTGFEAGAGLEQSFAEFFAVSLQLAYQYVLPDSLDDDIADSTGRQDLYATPGAAWAVSDEFGLRAFVGLHLFGRTRGLQLVAPAVFWLRAYYEI